MPEKINFTANAQITGGLGITVSRLIEVDAYDKLEVIIEDKAEDKKVEVLPGRADNVKFLMVTSDAYGKDLKYKVNEGNIPYELDQPHILVGLGAIKMFPSYLHQLQFSNGLGRPVSVQILVGRGGDKPTE